MSILIRHSDIPKYGHRIVILSDGHAYYEDFINPYVDLGEVVPVPSHGDLIDRDALKDEGADVHEDVVNCGYVERSVWGFSHEMLDAAPVIIPAEEGEI